MNKQHINSSVDKVKGKVKEEVGHLTGNTRMESEGIVQQVVAKVEKVAGNVKDTVKSGIDKVLKH
jgi:uncharacterized protein YjbJ (UPF0337 family)